MTKDKLIEILKSILKTDVDLGFMYQLEQKQLEVLVACIRDRLEQKEGGIR